MMKVTSRILKSGALVGMALMLAGTSWGQQSPAQTKAMTAYTPRVISESGSQAGQEQKAQAAMDQNDEMADIFRLIDQVEDKFPQAHSLLGQLRGKLNIHQRRSAQRLARSSNTALSCSVEPSRTRGPRREALPGEGMYSQCTNLKDEQLVRALNMITATGRPVDYRAAREQMFFKVDNHGGEVECVYTGRRERVANQLPSDRDMNCEHTWPQSLGATGEAKCDLHHLYPTDSKANGIRGSLPFGMVSNPNWADGGSKCDGDKFEIRPSHRGNAARSKFYFSMRYGKSINQEEEKILREWHTADPVDAAERARNDAIENVQHNRNPFVDHPEFVDQISDF